MALIKPPCTNGCNIPLSSVQLNEIARTEKCVTIKGNLNQYIDAIKIGLANYEISILKQESVDDNVVLLLDALVNHENTSIVVKPFEDCATLTDINGVTLGTIVLDDVNSSIECITKTNSMYRKSSNASRLYEAINNLLTSCNDFLDSWTTKASLWPDDFGISKITDMIAKLLNVDSDMIEQQVSLNISAYTQINGQDELLYCNNNRLNINTDDIERVHDAIVEQITYNKELKKVFKRYGAEEKEHFESAIEFLEKTFNLDLQATIKVDNAYPHEAIAIIKNNGLESCIRSSNFESRLKITSFSNSEEDADNLDVVYIDGWENNYEKLAEVIARTLKFDELFDICIDDMAKKQNTVQTISDAEKAYLSKLLTD